MELRNGNFIAKVTEKQESKLPELKDVEEAVTKDLIQKKSMDKAKDAADAFLKTAQEKDGWDGAVTMMTPPVDTTGSFARNQTVPKIGADSKQAADAFNLKTVGQVVPTPFQNRDGYYVVRLHEKLPATQEDFDQEKETLMANLLNSKSQEYIQQWLAEAKSKAQIKIEQSFM